jgi:hypothetical protein
MCVLDRFLIIEGVDISNCKACLKLHLGSNVDIKEYA